MEKYLTLLGLSGDATIDTVKAAYRKKAKQCHPDSNHNANSNKEFRELAEAYEKVMKHLDPDIEKIDFNYATMDKTGDIHIHKVNEEVIESIVDQFQQLMSQSEDIFGDNSYSDFDWEFNLPNGQSYTSEQRSRKIEKKTKKMLE